MSQLAKPSRDAAGSLAAPHRTGGRQDCGEGGTARLRAARRVSVLDLTPVRVVRHWLEVDGVGRTGASIKGNLCRVGDMLLSGLRHQRVRLCIPSET
jgi:hypothetical protein